MWIFIKCALRAILGAIISALFLGVAWKMYWGLNAYSFSIFLVAFVPFITLSGIFTALVVWILHVKLARNITFRFRALIGLGFALLAGCPFLFARNTESQDYLPLIILFSLAGVIIGFAIGNQS